MFSHYVSKKLDFYVYRLIDPRSGETFYVGKGKGNRVFQHAHAEVHAGKDDLNDKLQLIREIRRERFEVIHVIHRHGLSEDQALEVEAALIEAYPAVTNEIGGRAADDRGAMHARQIIERYEAKEAEFKHRAVIITVNKSVAERESVYAAVRYAWKLDPKKAEAAEVVLAVEKGLVVGVFRATRWMRATPANFPGTAAERPGRWGFEGEEAPKQIRDCYLGRRLPDSMRKRGAANPVRYA